MTEENLRELVAVLGRIDPTQITAATPLNGPLAGSLGRAKLAASLRSKWGVSNAGVFKLGTYGELCSMLSLVAPGADAAASTPSALPPAFTSSNGFHLAADGMQIGIDLETIAAMPSVADFWEDEFYKSTFTPREIAHALMQPSPLASFAGMWSAKEALHKAVASLAKLDLLRIEVVHDAAGKPDIAVDGQPIGGALSLSHTDELTIAVFVASPPPAKTAPPDTAELSVDPAVAPITKSGRGPAAMALLALLLSLAAVVLSLFRR